MPSEININPLVSIMEELREKCPWDKKQTIETLRQQTIEETYELADAITRADWLSIKEELGDMLIHIIFYATIAKEKGHFNLQEVIDQVADKLVRRHPHIYGDVKVKDAEEVKKNWQEIKQLQENKSILGGIPEALPSMVKAMRIQEKAKQAGFEWANKEEVWLKVEEEKEELMEAVNRNNNNDIEEETGDLFFSLINYARFINIDAENALEKTNKKFIKRFLQMELMAAGRGKIFSKMTLAEMDALWNEIKKQELH